ncbi:glycoside hydrolase family 18 protein [Trichocladium antarcticum]|uniref:chitinase n=1 Tax=Trichocladium antarcticum TaxID=1450529 RepID=A0AAN6ZGF2_9PEZI|nr:glycoside hydrolase family 18 protein [Trichocladium antarcticum]
MTSASHVLYTNAVYWPNFRVYNGDTPGQLNYGCINRVYYAFANVTMDGGVFLSDEYADARAPCDGVQGALGSLMHLKQRYPHLQVVLSIGGGGSAETFPIVASNTILRDNFARSARGLVDASGLDGIDSTPRLSRQPLSRAVDGCLVADAMLTDVVVWEYPSDSQQGRDFLALLAAIRIHLPEDRYLLTAALPAARPILQHIDLRRAAEYVDVFNMTAYDFFGSWTPRSGHHAQLYSANKDETSGASGVQYMMASGVAGKKILLGIPLFGRSFLHVAGPGHKMRGVGGADGTFEYNQLPRKGTKEQVDKRAVAAQCVGGDGGFGLFYWSAPSDSKDSKRSLITTGFKTLHSS